MTNVENIIPISETFLDFLEGLQQEADEASFYDSDVDTRILPEDFSYAIKVSQIKTFGNLVETIMAKSHRDFKDVMQSFKTPYEDGIFNVTHPNIKKQIGLLIDEFSH
jgi:hypothetical protein